MMNSVKAIFLAFMAVSVSAFLPFALTDDHPVQVAPQHVLTLDFARIGAKL